MKKQVKNKSYLFKIIDKYISRTSTSKEDEALINYYESFQKNKNWKEELGNENLIKKTIHTKIFKRVKKHKNESKVISLHGFLKYAAVFTILIAASTVFINTNFSEQAKTRKAVQKIKPGYEKATLILSDGSLINLEESKNKEIASNSISKIHNTNTKLVYKTVGKPVEDKFTEIEVLNTLIVPKGGMYQVTLSDGTNVWLNSQTSLIYPEKFIGNTRKVKLDGEAYFEVAKDEKQFIVETLTANVHVLGTHFNVSSYESDKNFATTLVEGKVSLTTQESSIILSPGEQGFSLRESKNLTVKKVDTKIYTAWKEGKFYFEKGQLEQILTKMSRWYNIDVLFEDQTIKQEVFTGVALKNKSIDYLLNIICETTSLTYSINNNIETSKYEVKIARK